MESFLCDTCSKLIGALAPLANKNSTVNVVEEIGTVVCLVEDGFGNCGEDTCEHLCHDIVRSQP